MPCLTVKFALCHAICGCRNVLATEVSKPAVAAASENLAANGVGNVAIARLTAEELGTAWRGERSFERLRLAGVDLAAMAFSTILVRTDGAPPASMVKCWVILACRGTLERLRLAGGDLAAMSFSTTLVSTDGAPPASLVKCWVVLACRSTLERLRLAGVDLAAMSFSTILVSNGGLPFEGLLGAACRVGRTSHGLSMAAAPPAVVW